MTVQDIEIIERDNNIPPEKSILAKEELKEIFSKDTRSLEELVNSLIERKAISRSIARKYFGVN